MLLAPLPRGFFTTLVFTFHHHCQLTGVDLAIAHTFLFYYFPLSYICISVFYTNAPTLFWVHSPPLVGHKSAFFGSRNVPQGMLHLHLRGVEREWMRWARDTSAYTYTYTYIYSFSFSVFSSCYMLLLYPTTTTEQTPRTTIKAPCSLCVYVTRHSLLCNFFHHIKITKINTKEVNLMNMR